MTYTDQLREALECVAAAEGYFEAQEIARTALSLKPEPPTDLQERAKEYADIRSEEGSEVHETITRAYLAGASELSEAREERARLVGLIKKELHDKVIGEGFSEIAFTVRWLEYSRLNNL